MMQGDSYNLGFLLDSATPELQVKLITTFTVKQKLPQNANRSTLRIPLSGISGKKYLHLIGWAAYEIYNIWVE